MSKQLKIKVCGNKYQDNLERMARLSPDYLGFIFFEKSLRNVIPEQVNMNRVSQSIKKVGVFVNSTIDVIQKTVRLLSLQCIQLHGEESPETCESLKATGLEIIKVFRVSDTFNFEELNPYVGHIDYFLFDTRAAEYGGTGKKFDWSILENYSLNVPFFLSGGIGLSDVDELLKMENKALFGVDINSGFETEPAVKDEKQVAEFIKRMRTR